MCGIDNRGRNGVEEVLARHDMNILRNYAHTDLRIDGIGGVVLHLNLVAVGCLDEHFVVDALEDARRDAACPLSVARLLMQHNILGTNHHINGGIGFEALVDAFEILSHEIHQIVALHRAVEDVAFADEVGHEGVGWLVVDVGGCANLLDNAVVHHDDGVGH